MANENKIILESQTDLQNSQVPSKKLSYIYQYGSAVALSVLSVFLLVNLKPLYTDRSAPLIFLALPIAVAANFGGTKPGLLTTLLCGLGAWGWLVPPAGFAIPLPGEILRITLTVITGIILSLLAGSLHRANHFLRLSEQQLRTMADSSPHLAWIAKADGFIAWYNHRWYEYTGTTYGQMQGWGWQSVHDPDMLPKVMKQWKASIAAGNTFEMEFPLRGADGKFRTFLTRGVPLKDSQGHVIQWYGTNTDISHRAEEEALLRRTSEELRRANKELEHFASIASHDLQEPLRMVTGFMELLEQRYKEILDDKAKEYISFAVDGVNRMSALITALLAYSRTGGRDIVLAPTDVDAVLGTVRINMKMTLDESAASITHDPLPIIVADTGQITQVFMNLVGNAIKFRSPDRHCQVHVSAKAVENEWVFSVRDNGIGIDPQYKDRIFMIFERLHDPKEYAGTGIGLAICKKIVERHGGRIWVESEPGKGATFYFTIAKAK